MVVRLLHEAGVHFHLTTNNRFHFFIDSIPGRNLCMAFRQFTVFRNDAEFFLTCKRLLAQLVPTLIEFAFVFVRPFFWNVMRSMGCARGIIDKERPVGSECLLLTYPGDRVVGEIFVECVSLLWCLSRLDTRGAFKQVRIVLMCFPAYEAIEVLEAAAARRPVIEWSNCATFPNGHFVAFAELSS